MLHDHLQKQNAHTGPKASESFVFHPREIAFCGYSGTGKTTLISRLLGELSPTYAIGYVKHDAHRFDMDIPGKDTYEARRHGANAVLINDADHWAVVSNGAMPMAAMRAILAPLDLVFIEGYKNSPIPKIVVMDGREDILRAVKSGRISAVSAYVGSRDRYPALNAAYYHRDDLEGIKRHILAALGFLQGA
jgi:molybdopterin-guanine dinucleotide biosynthesis protein MobB